MNISWFKNKKVDGKRCFDSVNHTSYKGMSTSPSLPPPQAPACHKMQPDFYDS